MIDPHHGWNVSTKPLILGFVLSIILLAAAYLTMFYSHLKGWDLIWTVVLLGCVQVFFQLIFFLHLGLESKPRWNLIALIFTIFVIFILVGGSMWIMHNLRYNVM